MNGGSLGLRLSTSFSSLEQQLENGLVYHQNSHIVRRPSKTSLPVYREKERTITSGFRYLSRKKIGMLILVAFTVAFMTGFFTLNKDYDLQGSEFPFKIKDLNKVSVCHTPHWDTSLDASASGLISRDLPDSKMHPCQNFASLSSPPAALHGSGPRPCPVCYVPVEEAIARMPEVPPPSPILRRLNYHSELKPMRTEMNGDFEFGGNSEFGGYPALRQRNDSFTIKETMTVHCGFVKGCKPGYETGFDIDIDDRGMLEKFHNTVVASAIFGNYDEIHQPENVSEISKRNIPFFMFVDEETETYLRNSSLLGSDMHVGLWRIVVVHNLPYVDARRNGKVPKLLLHRLFPRTRYSLWIDAKLQLLVDPYQILERFLWRQNATFAISRHYTRFSVFEEAEANKAGGKYQNASIDHQIEFYMKEGLTPYTEAKLPITSDVPEGCVLVREHIPITNLFSCLWFNEVDRFTSRDQLSFSTVRDKIQSQQVEWSVNMFLDCERRSFVRQDYHRDVLREKARKMARKTRLPPPLPPPSRVTVSAAAGRRQMPSKSAAVHRMREKKTGSRRRRKSTQKGRESSFFLR